jgi:hypothetical protein
LKQFVGRSTLRNHHHRIARLVHSKIAVLRFGGMKKDRRRSGALERCGQVAGDMPGLANAHDDDFAGLAQNAAAATDDSIREAAAKIA